MTTPIELGRIEWRDIRDVWKHEAAGFTPWLLANADELGKTLGIDIQLERAEHSVGTFSLDLIGRDLTHDARLIVENQVEPSDHSHLGQLLTYAAGTDAKTIVWIARSFSEPHRVALDWLNANTGEDIRFFAVVVKALSVDNSRPAPFFEVVAKPNDWQKAVKASTSGQESATAEAYRAFWAPLRDAFESAHPELVAGRGRPRWIWFTINSPLPRTTICAEIGAGELRTVLDIDTGDRAENLRRLDLLRAQRATLEAKFGPFDFNAGTRLCRIFRRKPWPGRRLDQSEEQQAEAREWFEHSLLEFREAFEQVASTLDEAT